MLIIALLILCTSSLYAGDDAGNKNKSPYDNPVEIPLLPLYYTMQKNESLGYDPKQITIVNSCPYPVTVQFDASHLSVAAVPSALGYNPEYGKVSHTFAASTTRNEYFLRLVLCKNGVDSVLSTLHAHIKAEDGHHGPCSLELNPAHENQKLLIFDKNGITATTDLYHIKQ